MKLQKFTLFHPSTRSFFREGSRADDYSWFDGLHGYVYARWPYLYISIGVGEHYLARTVRPRISRVVRWVRRGNRIIVYGV